MTNPGLLTISASDTPAVFSAMRSVLAGEATLAIIPKANSNRINAVISAINPNQPVSSEVGLITVTSGSTGKPKAVEISHNAIQSSISAVNEELGVTPQWHLVLPLQHIAGTMTALRGLALNSKLHNPTINAADPTQLAAYAKSVKDLSAPHAIALVPEHLKRLAVINEIASLRYFFKVIIGAGSLSQDLIEKLTELGINFVSSYGLTETCGGIVWDGKPLNSVALSLNNDNEVLVQSNMNATRYRNNGLDLTTINTRDLGYFESGKLVITGRSDSKVKIKGHLLDLADTSESLQRMTESEATALLAKDTLYLIVTNLNLTESQLMENLMNELGDGIKGAKVVVKDKLPRTELGKLDMFSLRLELEND